MKHLPKCPRLSSEQDVCTCHPRPIRDSECTECLEVRPLLMPVHFFAGSLDRCTTWLCVDCRLNWMDDRWACLASTLDHAPSRAGDAVTEDTWVTVGVLAGLGLAVSLALVLGAEAYDVLVAVFRRGAP